MNKKRNHSVRADRSAPASKFRKPVGQRPPSRTKRGGKASLDGPLLLYGLHAVRAALGNPTRKSKTLYVSENALPRLGDDLVQKSKVAVRLTPPTTLDQMVASDAVHQGVIMECDPLPLLDASELFQLADCKLVLALDQITDPHNVGAILRSAVAMGVEAVMITHRNSALETGALAKAASGALDNIKLIGLRNFSKGLAELNEMGFATIGLDSEGPLILEETLKSVARKPICLVLGSEGKGLREQSRNACTALARLDMPGPIKSLNVSNAAALSLYLTAASIRAVND